MKNQIARYGDLQRRTVRHPLTRMSMAPQKAGFEYEGIGDTIVQWLISARPHKNVHHEP
jgi:hypothetical protein